MFGGALKLFGLNYGHMAELVAGGFVAVLAALLAGIFIDALMARRSFGPFANTLLLLFNMAGGLIVYSQFVRPLSMTPLMSIAVIAAASAIAGFTAMSVAFTGEAARR